MKLKDLKAFTLIELLVVILIVGILSGVAVPKYRRSVERARAVEAQSVMRALYDSCERWIWEKQPGASQDVKYNYQRAPLWGCFSEMHIGHLTFAQLDLMIKGKYTSIEGAYPCIQTDNFKYCLQLTSPGSLLGGNLWAYPMKKYKDEASIAFNGTEFWCGPAGSEACEVWGVSQWAPAE